MLKVVRISKVLYIVVYLIELAILYVVFEIIGIPHGPVFIISTHGLKITKELWQIPFVFGGYHSSLFLSNL